MNFRGAGAVLLTLILITVMPGCGTGREEKIPELRECLEETIDFYREKGGADNWWEILALYGAGVDLHGGDWQLPPWEFVEPEPGSQATVYAGYILGLMARGENPRDRGGRNLPEELSFWQKEDGSFGGAINNSIWAVIALETSGFPYASGPALSFLLSEQKEDGGFALGGTRGDPDVTAMALIAMSFFRDRQEAQGPMGKALDYLTKARLSSGGYASWGTENSNSAAMVICALVALGEDLNATPWSDQNLMGNLFAYRIKGGSFSFMLDPRKPDPMATCQALMAMGDVAASRSVFHRLKEGTR